MRLLGNLSYWNNVSPTGAVQDFISVWRDNPYRWRVLGVSIVLTSVMLYGFVPKSERAAPARPSITYISTFEPGRSEAEIVASNVANQARKDRLAAVEAEREELRKDLWRQLGRATFVDVDAMERQIAEDKAAEAAAARAAAPHPSGTPIAGER